MASKKIDLEFCISDESVNVYGYRLLTRGFMQERFAPPIGFLMHEREAGVAVRWTDIRTEAGKIFAKPVVNTDRFPNLEQEILDGFYAAASVGHIVAIDISDDPKYKLEGQTGPTVLKWFPRECSIVDIPGNYNAIAKLYDDSGNLLYDLTDNFNKFQTNKEMSEKTFKAADLKLPGVKPEHGIDEINQQITDLVAKAGKVDDLEKELADLRGKKAEADKRSVKEIVEKALADKKLTREVADLLGKEYATRPEELQKLVDAMKPAEMISDKLSEGDVPKEYQGKSWADLYHSGELERVKEQFPELYDKLKAER